MRLYLCCPDIDVDGGYKRSIIGFPSRNHSRRFWNRRIAFSTIEKHIRENDINIILDFRKYSELPIIIFFYFS